MNSALVNTVTIMMRIPVVSYCLNIFAAAVFDCMCENIAISLESPIPFLYIGLGPEPVI